MSSNDPVIRQMENEKKRLEEKEHQVQNDLKQKRNQLEGIERDEERRQTEIRALENQEAQLVGGIKHIEVGIVNQEHVIEAREKLEKEEARRIRH